MSEQQEMRDVFFPPPGAMQFEITDPRVAAQNKEQPLWVIPYNGTWSKKLWGQAVNCACTEGFWVIWAPDSLARIQNNTNRIVCTCVGRIIE